MNIPVVFKDGQARSDSKEELQFLMVTKRILSIKRSGGWAVVGRDKMREEVKPFKGKDRLEHTEFDKNHWY